MKNFIIGAALAFICALFAPAAQAQTVTYSPVIVAGLPRSRNQPRIYTIKWCPGILVIMNFYGIFTLFPFLKRTFTARPIYMFSDAEH